MFPYYVSLSPTNALRVTVGKNYRYLLVMPAIPKGVQVTTNIIPNLQKMEFINHNLRKFLEIVMNIYMTTIRTTEYGPIHVVLMEWERGMDKSRLLSLMHMPHYGHTIEVNGGNILSTSCVK